MLISQIIISLLPPGLIFFIGALSFIHLVYVTVAYSISVVSRMEKMLLSIAMFNFTLFYFLRWVDVLDLQGSIAFSRLNYVWLSLVTFYVTRRVVHRHRKEDRE